jgi:hypothetical protein
MDRAFEQYITRYADFTALEGESADVPAARDNSAEIEAIMTQLAQIEGKHKEIMALFVAGSIDFSDYQGMTAIGAKRRVELNERLAFLDSMEQAAAPRHTGKEIAANIRDNWAGFNNEERQRFVQMFIRKIVVRTETHPNGFWTDVVIDEIVFNEF